MKSPSLLAALLLATGIALGGYFVGKGILGHNKTSKIAVKGLAEREVPASIAIWTLSYSATDDKLAEVDHKLAEGAALVKEFLKAAGFQETDIALQPPSLRDHSMETPDKGCTGPCRPLQRLPVRAAAHQVGTVSQSSRLRHQHPDASGADAWHHQ